MTRHCAFTRTHSSIQKYKNSPTHWQHPDVTHEHVAHPQPVPPSRGEGGARGNAQVAQFSLSHHKVASIDLITRRDAASTSARSSSLNTAFEMEEHKSANRDTCSEIEFTSWSPGAHLLSRYIRLLGCE